MALNLHRNRMSYPRIAAAVVALALVIAFVSASAQSDRRRLERARDAVAERDYAGATDQLERLVEESSGETLQESLYLLGGLQRNAREAERLYRRVIDDDPSGEWAQRSQLELAKVQYALGNYERSWRILNDADACEVSEEACLFEGLSALMLQRYQDARRPLSRIRRGKLRTWAYLSLAETATGQNRPDEACDRYQSLAGALISPTALYRYGECLEDAGEVDDALDEFEAIIENFPDTPEAVLAAEKLQRITGQVPPPQEPIIEPSATEKEPVEKLESGFTIQFGSFRDRGNAIKLAAKIKRVYPGVRIDSDLISYREFHRVRYGYFPSREVAQKKADEISREMNEDFTIMSLP